MPVNITAAPKHTGVAIARPIPGEPAAMETGPAPMGPELQKVVDRLELYFQATLGEMRGGETFRVLTGGTSTTGSAELNAIDRLVITDASGVTWAVTTSGNPVSFLASTDFPGGTLPNNAWVYASVSVATDGTTLVSHLGTDPPSADRVWIEGFEGVRRYVGCFRTTSAGAPFPAMCVRGRYLYQRGAIASVDGAFGANGMRAVVDASAVGRTALDLSARIPPHARRALVFGQSIITSISGAAATALNLYSASDATSVAQEIIAQVANDTETSRNSSFAEVDLTAAQVMGYSVVKTGTGLELAELDLIGFE